MIFDRLRSVLAGQPAGPNSHLAHALVPIRAAAEQLYERALGFVHDGSGPEVLLELDASHQPDLERLLMDPGRVQSRNRGFNDALRQRLLQVGIQGDPTQTVPGARSQLYRDPTTSQPQFLRFGYLLAALGNGPNRRVDGVPLWLTALLNDIATVTGKGDVRSLQWPPERFADLLRHDGAPETDIPTIVFLAMSEQEDVWGHSIVRPHELPGIDNYLLGFGHLIPPASVLRLGALARVGVAERTAADVRVSHVLAPVLAQLAADKAKTVRAAAVPALSQLPQQVQGAVLRPVLATVPAASSTELVEYLSRTDAGAALLDDAVAAGAQFGAAVEKARARQAALGTAPQAQPLVLPPFTPIPDDLDEGRAVGELHRLIDSQIARMQASEHAQQVTRVRQLRQVTDADLRQLVAVAAGRLPAPKRLELFSVNTLAQAVPSFNLIHLIRLDVTGRTRAPWLVGTRADDITDLRQVADALHRTGARSEAWESLPQLGRVSSYWLMLQPEVTWPWFAQRLDLLQAWLGGSSADVGDALAILEAFPVIPPALLAAVASVAVGDSRRHRPLAQALLARHGSARQLAEQGLTDSKGEIRTASAGWLGTLADPAAIPALRAGLAKEKREVVRAAILNALADIGDDISADLAPAKLLAEAKAGLRARIPAALDWFGFDQLPPLAWRDGTGVDPAIPRWWAVLANKMKDPDGSGLVDLYLGQLDPDAAAALGRFALASWIAQDTRHPAHEESRAHAAAESRRRYDWAQEYLKRVQGNPQRVQHLTRALHRAAIPLEEYVRDAYAEHQGTYLGSATANRGLLALTTRMPGSELTDTVQSYIRNHGGRRAQVDALMYPLYANGEPAAVQLLLSISRRFKQASVQATATSLVETLADKRGWTADELADRTIPTAGFDSDALLRLDFGSRQFLGRATPSGVIELSTAEGTPIKALPAARAADDAEQVSLAKKQLTASRKELKAVLAQQTLRLYEAMCTARTWTVPDWREFLLDHPLVGQLLSRLVWLENPGPGQRPFRPTEDGSLIDADDDTIELADDASVGLAHRVSLGDPAAAVWRAHLADYEVTPLFAQFDNPLPDLDRRATQTRDLQGHLTDTFSFRGVATKRGYQRGQAEDGAWFAEYTRGFSAAGLTAVLEFTGSYVPEENFACATIGLSFRGGRNRAVPLADVPDVLLAECYGDYAALAALGPFDPDWEKKAGA